MNRYNYYPIKKFGKCTRISRILKYYGNGIYNNYSISYKKIILPLIKDKIIEQINQKNFMDYCLLHIDFDNLKLPKQKNFMDYCLLHIDFDNLKLPKQKNFMDYCLLHIDFDNLKD